LDAKYSYPSKTGIGTTTSGAAAPAGSSTDVDVNTWYDMSGNGNDGELIGGVGYGSSVVGRETLIFDGTNDFVRFSNFIVSSGSFTYEAWALTKAITSENTLIDQESSTGVVLISSGNNALASLGYRFLVRNGGFLGDGSNQVNLQGIVSGINFNTWHCYTGTFDNTTATGVMYVDGVRVDSGSKETARNWNLSSGTSPRVELGVSSGGDRFLNGNIAIAKVYNRALTAAEVLQNYNALKGRFGLS